MDEITLYDSYHRLALENCCNMLDALSGAVSRLHEGATEGECLALSNLAINVKRALERVDEEMSARPKGEQPTGNSDTI